MTTNRTEWPLDGGSVLFNPSHEWAITYVNLGLGSDDSVIFNISLVEGFNQTGNGTFCFPKIRIPQGLGLTAGSNASIQVVQLTELGSALYNVSSLSYFLFFSFPPFPLHLSDLFSCTSTLFPQSYPS